jgi:hypothetical protein
VIKILRIISVQLSLLVWLVGSVTILFLLLNLAAVYLLKHAQSIPSESVFSRITAPQSSIGLAVFRRMFGSSSDEDALSRHSLAPGFAMHPGLHYMTQSVNNAHYHIGIEGMRYEAGWDDEKARTLLRNPNILLFGGSTAMGHAVSHDETITHYMNVLSKKDGDALNFGSQAYDFQRAAEKLAYLLRIGYRPQKVVFLIGWNEIAGSARSNLRWQDKVIYHGFSVHRGEVAYTAGAPQASYLRLFADTLPIMQYLKMKQSADVHPNKPNRDPFTDGFDFREAQRLFTDWESFALANRKLLQSEVLQSLLAHSAFVRGLGQAFHFDVEIVLQPMGLFEPDNPFVPQYARDAPDYKYLYSLRAYIREKIAKRELDITDGADWLSSVNNDRYVDVAHYSPASNSALAAKILGQIR